MGGAEQEFVRRVENDIQEALLQLREIEERIEAGEEISETELSVMMYEIAGRIEDARERLERRVGGISRETLAAGVAEHLGEEKAQEWRDSEPDRVVFRHLWDRERTIREQLVPGYDNPTKDPNRDQEKQS